MNLCDPDPACRLNYVPNKPQSAKMDYALSSSFGFRRHQRLTRLPPLDRTNPIRIRQV